MTVEEILRRLRLFVLRDRMTAELEEEMRTHVTLRTELLQRGGMSERDASAAANRRFGNRAVLAEAGRDTWGLGWLEHAAQDLRHAVRRLRQHPAFACAVIGVLALGIGSTSAMFIAVDAALLRPLPFPRPVELVALPHVQLPFDPGFRVPSAPQHILDVRDVAGMTGVFAHVAAYAAGGLNLSDPERPIRVKVGVVTSDFFPTVGVSPLLGRGFAPHEGVPHGPLVTVLSYALWQRQFGGRSIAHLTASLNGKSYVVIGVMPRGFGFPSESDLWIPMTVPNTFATFEGFRGFLPSTVIARTAAGTGLDAARSALRARWEQSLTGSRAPPDGGSNLEMFVDDIRHNGAITPLQVDLVGDRRLALLVLLGATGFLLLIACANVTNLLLSHAAARRHEFALREALGASLGRIVRQLLAESMLLAFTGAALGVALTAVALTTIRALVPVPLAGLAPARLDWRVVGFASLLAVVTGVGFGLWPALSAARADFGSMIKSSGGHGATSGSSGRVRRALVSVELALTLMLLTGAGLMMRSFTRLVGLDTGMTAQRVGTLEISFPESVAGSATATREIDAIVARLSATPGIDAAGVVNDLPLRGGGGIALRISNPVPPGTGDFSGARYLMASDEYFRALGIALIAGRSFVAADGLSSAPVAVVSETMAKTFWPGANAVGHTFQLAERDRPITVIGVVADVREQSLDHDPMPQMYLPIAAHAPANIAIVARGTLPPKALLSRLTDAVRAVDRSQAVYNVRMMEDVIGNSVAPQRINTLLISAFALMALLLSALGVYAVVACAVTQRHREFGIRAALGASARDLVGLVAGEMTWMTTVGVLAGFAGAWAFSRALSGLLYGVRAHDAATFIAMPVALVVPVVLATIVPARRALRVNPAEVMRTE